MAQLTEAERVKRWLRGMRAADELSQRLRAAEGSKLAGTVAQTPGRQRAGPRKVGARAAYQPGDEDQFDIPAFLRKNGGREDR